MKKVYERPVVTIELYELNDAIAAGCVTIYTLYPENPSDDSVKKLCFEDYESLTAASITTPFWNENCSCYYGSGNAPALSS